MKKYIRLILLLIVIVATVTFFEVLRTQKFNMNMYEQNIVYNQRLILNQVLRQHVEEMRVLLNNEKFTVGDIVKGHVPKNFPTAIVTNECIVINSIILYELDIDKVRDNLGVELYSPRFSTWHIQPDQGKFMLVFDSTQAYNNWFSRHKEFSESFDSYYFATFVTSRDIATDVFTKEVPNPTISHGVTYNGALQVNGPNLQNQHGENFQLIGMSSHGLNWSEELLTKDSLIYLRDVCKTNVIRLALYPRVRLGAGKGFIQNPSLKYSLIKMMDWAIELDMYVIVDWHTLHESDPNVYLEEAIEFFDYISRRYQNVPNVLYEICNEPNGEHVLWEHIYSYAVQVIETIRRNSPDAVIIVGTPHFSTDLEAVLTRPLSFHNVLYAFHFYADDDGHYARLMVEEMVNHGMPIFVSECAPTTPMLICPITEEPFTEEVLYIEEFLTWVNFLNEHNISWIVWAYFNVEPIGRFLDPSFVPGMVIDDNLSKTGKFLKELFIEQYALRVRINELRESGLCLTNILLFL